MIDQAQGIKDLLAWAAKNGCTHSPILEFQYQPHRGVFAVSKKSHKFEEPQLRVPTRLIIHGGVARRFFGKELATSETNLNGGLKLLWAKLKFDEKTLLDGLDLNEFYKSYIALLPEGKETGSVFYWNSEEMRLLDNTNLGGSLPAKFQWLVDEWFNTVSDLPETFKTPQLDQDLKFKDEYMTYSRDGLLEQLLNVKSWTSFGAYLWSTTIFTSRAFPHKIIDPSAKDGQAMFVPLIDLLNHNNSTVIDWKYEQTSEDGFFTMHNLDRIEAGGEVYNNYGAKGNEELLMGYGFVIDSNPNDSVALRVKPPFQAVLNAKKMGVHIPKIDDYTYHAFATDEPQGDELTEKNYTGLLYFLNHKSLLPENLVRLFMALMKNEEESKFTVRQRLEALQNLRNAFESKHRALSKSLDVDVEQLEPHVVRTAKIYRAGQLNIYKSTMSKLRATEKEILHENRAHVMSFKKLYKKDSRLREGLALFGLNTWDDIEDEEEEGDLETFLSLWVILHSEVPVPESDEKTYAAPDWVKNTYDKYKREHNTAELPLPQPMRPMIQLKQGLRDHVLAPFLNEDNLAVAAHVIQMNSYARGSGAEPILVEPLHDL